MGLKKLIEFRSLLFVTTTALYAAAAVDAPYEVGKWANFCQGAVTHGFDDNMNTNPTAVEQTIFDDKKFHITLHVQTASPNWSDCKASFAKGHEISSHSVSHSSNSSEIKPSQDAIKKNVPGEMCVTMAYPNCNTPGDAAVLQTYIAGRNCDGQTAAASPTNMAQISAKMFGTCSGCPNDANGMNSFADQAVSKKGWSVYCHHGIGSQSHSWATTNLNAMKSHLEYLDTNRDKIWMETFGNVARYIRERDAASVTKKDSTSKGITLSVSDNLADTIFNYPLSIRRPLPDGWTKAAVKQGDKDVEDTIVTVSSKQYVMFKAVPDGGDILISNPDIVAVTGEHRTAGSPTALVTRQNFLLTLNRRYFDGEKVSVTFFDISGKVIGKRVLGASESGIDLRDNHLTTSTFIAKVTDGKKSYSDIFMPQM